MDYKNAGVDIEAGYESVELMKKFVKTTMRPEVLGGLGGFSGAFSLSKIKDMENPTDEDIITVHLGRVVSEELYNQIVKDIIRLLERKYPSDANWYLDS